MIIVFFGASLSIFIKCIELTLYANDGYDRPFLRALQIIIENTVWFLVTTILILLGLG